MRGRTILQRLQKQFPQVKKVVDAKEAVTISVTENDSRSARKKDANGCAMAVACVKKKIAEHAVIQISKAYLIKGDTATRYQVPPSVAREITSFDRHHDFAAADDYHLDAVSKANRLGRTESNGKRGPHEARRRPPLRIHKTANIRKTSY